jgi:dihydroflavonol-4-reductase
MKVLVTGASSALGANIIRILLLRGYPVRAFIRKSSNISALTGLPIEFFKGDIGDKNDLVEGIKGCEYVIHAAANMELSTGVTTKQEEDNIKAVEHLAKSCVDHKIKRLVYISTANTIGPGNKEHPGIEENKTAKWFERSGYAKSKLLAEELIQKHVLEDGLDALILNPSFMLGPYDTKPTSNRIILQFYKKRFNFIPPGGKSFIHVKDVAVAACNALTMGNPGENYLLTNENLTYLEFIMKLEELTGQKSMKIHIPRRLVYFLGNIGSVLENLGMKRELNRTNARMLCTTAFYKSSKAVRELNLPLTPIEKAMEESLNWFQQNKCLK